MNPFSYGTKVKGDDFYDRKSNIEIYENHFIHQYSSPIIKFLAFALVLLLFPAAYPQTKTITLDDIYRNHTFRSRSVYGIRSMKDGEHYTTLDEGRYIVKYAYQTGQAVDTLI